MKYKAHIPTIEYGFIETESDNLIEVVAEHDRIRNLFSEQEGHNQLEWARVRNGYLSTGEMEIEDLEKCNKSQRFVINEFKLAIRSINKE